MSDLVAIIYQDEQRGFEALKELDSLWERELITLRDAAVIFRDFKGNVTVEQTLERQNTGAAAGWGDFWGLLIGLLFMGPIFWGIFSFLLGPGIARASDHTFHDRFALAVDRSLAPGGSAVFILIEDAAAERVVPKLQTLGGKRHQTTLSEQDEEALRTALENLQISAVAGAMLAL